MLTGIQIRGARVLLGWSRKKMGLKATLPLSFIVIVESSDGAAWLTDEQEAAIRHACEQAGIEFTSEDGSAGVRLRKNMI